MDGRQEIVQTQDVKRVYVMGEERVHALGGVT